MLSYSNPQTKDGFAMSALCADGAWHLVSPDAQLRVTGDVSLQETARVLTSRGDIQHVLRDFFITRLRYFEQRADFFRIYSVEVGNLGRAAGHIRQEHQLRRTESRGNRSSSIIRVHVQRLAVRAERDR